MFCFVYFTTVIKYFITFKTIILTRIIAIYLVLFAYLSIIITFAFFLGF